MDYLCKGEVPTNMEQMCKHNLREISSCVHRKSLNSWKKGSGNLSVALIFLFIACLCIWTFALLVHLYLELVLLAGETGKWGVMVPDLDRRCWRCRRVTGWETEWGRPGDSWAGYWPGQKEKKKKRGQYKILRHMSTSFLITLEHFQPLGGRLMSEHVHELLNVNLVWMHDILYISK